MKTGDQIRAEIKALLAQAAQADDDVVTGTKADGEPYSVRASEFYGHEDQYPMDVYVGLQNGFILKQYAKIDAADEALKAAGMGLPAVYWSHRPFWEQMQRQGAPINGKPFKMDDYTAQGGKAVSQVIVDLWNGADGQLWRNDERAADQLRAMGEPAP